MTLPLSSVLLQHRRRRENSQPKIDSFFSAGVYLASQLHTTINHLNKCSNISDTIWYLSLVAVQQRAAHIPQPLWGCFGRSAVPPSRYSLRDTPGPYRDGAGPYRHCAAQYRHTIPPPPSPRHSPSPHPTRSRTRPETVPVPTDTVTATQHCTTLISDICYILTLIDIDIW